MAKIKPRRALVAFVLIIIGLNVVIDTLVEALPFLIVLAVIISLLAFVLGWKSYF